MSSNATGSREFTVNKESLGDKSFSVVTGIADGGWVVSWTDSDQDGSGDGIYQQRYNADGRRIGQETLVNSTTLNGQYDPRIVMLEDGGWIVAWTGDGIYQQRYDAAGVRVGEETRVSMTTTAALSGGSVHMLDDGGWIVTWSADWSNPWDREIYQRRYSATGEAGEAETVNATTTAYRNGVTTTLLADGGWLVSWTHKEDSDFTLGIYQQRFDATGAMVEGEVKVDPVMPGWQASDPQSAALADGGWIVTWQSSPNDTHTTIFQQRFDSDGAAVGDEVEVSKGRADVKHDSAIAVLADGGWVVCWTDESHGFVGGLYQQRYDADGNRVGNQTQIGSGWLNGASVAGLEDGSWIVTWHSDSDTDNIYQRHFAPDISGGNEADDLVGTNWDERISGLDGSDKLVGGGGRDVLNGGAGRDVLVGSDGADTFVFRQGDTRNTRAGADTIEDFSVEQKDVIDISAIDANTKRDANNPFHFIGGERFHKEAGELRFEKKGGDTYVMGDTDGNGKADFMIHLDGAVKLVTGSFEL